MNIALTPVGTERHLVKLPHDLINLNKAEKVMKISQYSVLTDEHRWAFQELTTNAT